MKRVPWNKGKQLPTKYPKLRDAAWLQEQLNIKSMQKLAKEIGCSYKRVFDAKVELGVEPQNGVIRTKAKSAHPEVEENKDYIMSAYRDGELTTGEIAKKFDAPIGSITYYLHRKWKIGKCPNRKIARPYGIYVTKEDLEAVYFEKGVTSKIAAKQLGVSLRAFRGYLKKYGIETKKRESACPKLRDLVWLENEFITKERTTGEIATELNVSRGAVQNALRYIDIELRKKKGDRFGEKAPNWHGGRRLTAGGYIYSKADHHPNCTIEGYVMEHRLIMEEKLGRLLSKEEIVHHKNGDKIDNRIENLELVSDQGQHTKDHFERSNITEQAVIERDSAVNKVKELEGELEALKKVPKLEAEIEALKLTINPIDKAKTKI